MGKRKIFKKTSLDTPQVKHVRYASGEVVIPLKEIPPTTTIVLFGYNTSNTRKFNFAPWYGVGIDTITYACQRQIERFLDKQDAEVTVETVINYCCGGLRRFLEYLCLYSAALGREITLGDINRDVINGYLGFLRDRNTSTNSQKAQYGATKSVLKALCQRNLIKEILAGDEATFPRNPFPGSNKNSKGELPLPRSQRKAFSKAVKTAVMPIFLEDTEPTGELLAYALLVVALHTGRNTTPLLEMPFNCMRPHPKEGTTFLVLYKRRGHNTNKVVIGEESGRSGVVESLPTIRPTVAGLIKRAIQLTDKLRLVAPLHLRDRLWLYRTQYSSSAGKKGTIIALSSSLLQDATKALVAKYELVDTNGKPLRINVSRLRKTFINRIYEILDGDVAGTAAAAGNTPAVVVANYLLPGEEAQKNWKFMGATLVQELLNNTIGSTHRTPVGQCSDITNGDYAPKRSGATCMNFLSCLRCRNYVVTGEDLYRLFSFYWRILHERARMDPHRWQKHFAHIPRLIERDVIQAGLTKGVFLRDLVDTAQELARVDPHPFWRSETILADLEEGPS